ncbi:Protein EARLY RESPONSIVE TO DEHYDRATION 15 [Euphorbia peplus]|nr:Protein EARLY RESPONSIVE TO DEHYDRATION 15 [Euphorbia peplus]
MALVSGGRSSLNPDAPLFIPAAYRQVEDFSPEWWQLVTTSTWYKDYWLSQHQDAEGFYDNVEDVGFDVADLLPDTFDLDAGEYFSSLDVQYQDLAESRESGVATKSSPYIGLQKNGMVHSFL